LPHGRNWVCLVKTGERSWQVAKDLLFFKGYGAECKIKIHFPQIIGIQQKIPFFYENQSNMLIKS
jgi:hypothetical protein